MPVSRAKIGFIGLACTLALLGLSAAASGASKPAGLSLSEAARTVPAGRAW